MSEHLPQDADPALPRIAVKRQVESFGINQIEPVRLVDRPLQALAVELPGEVD